jgi:transcriptional regulator with GAF, ATPase, and Fis domain/ligand-binding sensor domain-containing protein
MQAVFRVSLWHPPGAATACAHAFFSPALTSHLGCHGFTPVADPVPATMADHSSRWFIGPNAGQLPALREALTDDPAWCEALADLGEICRATQAQAVDAASGAEPQGRPGEAGLPWTVDLHHAPVAPHTPIAAGAGQRHGVFHAYALADGLLSAVVKGLLEDRAGALWMATGDGLSRYDGSSFWHLTTADGLPQDHLLGMAQTPEGHLWFAGNGLAAEVPRGLCRFDGQALRHYNRADGLPSDAVTNVWVTPDGQLWVFTGAGMASWTGTSFAPVPRSDRRHLPLVLRACDGGRGKVWLATGDGLWQFGRDGRRSPVRVEDGPEGVIWSVVRDRRGRVWAGGPAGSWVLGERGGWSPADIPHTSVATAVPLLEDAHGALWWVTFPDGVCQWRQGDAQHLGPGDGLPGERVAHGICTRDGQVWLALDAGGVVRFVGDRLAPAGPGDASASRDCHFIRRTAAGSLLLGTTGGTCAWRHGRWQRPTPHISWQTALTEWLQTPAGDQWGVAHDGQVRHLPAAGGGRWSPSLEAPTAAHNCGSLAWVPALPSTTIGGLWCANGAEALHRHHESVWRHYGQPEGGPPGQVRAVAVDPRRERVYVGTTTGAVSWWDGDSFHDLESGARWGHRPVLHLFVARDGDLWIGTEGHGAWRWDGQALRPYTRAQGLAADRVLRIGQRRNGHLVLCTQGGGVSLFDGLVAQTLDQRLGLASDIVRDFLEDDDGCLWFATQDGVTRYRPGGQPPTLELAQIHADRRITAAEVEIQSNTPLAVPVSPRAIRFSLRAKGVWSGRPLFRYRWSGTTQGNWQVTPDADVECARLAVGAYTFEAQVVDQDLQYSPSIGVRIEVVPDPVEDALSEALAHPTRVGHLVGSSAATRSLRRQLEAVAGADMAVLLLGQTGTGKTLAARYLHDHSARRGERLVHVNCGTLTPGLADSSLFGHERGAFTGADRQRLGYVELAGRGTLFLDEVGEMDLQAQVRLLHVLDGEPYYRVGGRTPLRLLARVVAATNRDLPGMVAAGTFRADLYHRLTAFPVIVPPLAARVDDLDELVALFIDQHNRRHGRHVTGVSLAAMARLRDYTWPGNVRELDQVMGRAVFACQGLVIEVEHLVAGPPWLPARPGPAATGAAGAWVQMPAPGDPAAATGVTTNNGPGSTTGIDPDAAATRVRREATAIGIGAIAPERRSGTWAAAADTPATLLTLRESERRCLLAALEACDWVIEGRHGAAARLGAKPSTVRDRMARHHLRRPDRR